MEKKSTQPDQDNLNGKVKFVTNDTYQAPLFRNACEYQNNDLMYGTDGRLVKQQLNITTEYSKNNKTNLYDDEMDDSLSNTYFPGFNAPDNLDNNEILFGQIGDKKIVNKNISVNDDAVCDDYSCNVKTNINYSFRKSNDDIYTNERSRYINHGSYVPNGSMEVGGFGDLKNFSKLKYGENTRGIQKTIMDNDIDRFHFAFTNYQHENRGSNPFPEDSRRQNKNY